MEKIFVADSRILKWPGINWPEDVFCVIFKVVKICFMTWRFFKLKVVKFCYLTWRYFEEKSGRIFVTWPEDYFEEENSQVDVAFNFERPGFIPFRVCWGSCDGGSGVIEIESSLNFCRFIKRLNDVFIYSFDAFWIEQAILSKNFLQCLYLFAWSFWKVVACFCKYCVHADSKVIS